MVYGGSSGVLSHVDDVDPVTGQAGQDHEAAGLAGIIIAAGAGIPARVVDLIPHVAHRQTVDHLDRGHAHRVTMEDSDSHKKLN